MITESTEHYTIYVPECSCNEKVHRVSWSNSQEKPNDQAEIFAHDHELLHLLSIEVTNLLNEGVYSREDIAEKLPDFNEAQIAIAAQLAMAPLFFARRRKAPLGYNLGVRNYAFQMTELFHEMSNFNEEEDCYCDTHDDVTCTYHGIVGGY